MIPKNLNQVEIKRKKQNITGRGGLSWVESALRHIGFFEKIDELKPVKGRSNKDT